MEKKVSLVASSFIIMADVLMPEAQQPITVFILIIYSPNFLKDLIKLWEYISDRAAIN